MNFLCIEKVSIYTNILNIKALDDENIEPQKMNRQNLYCKTKIALFFNFSAIIGSLFTILILFAKFDRRVYGVKVQNQIIY